MQREIRIQQISCDDVSDSYVLNADSGRRADELSSWTGWCRVVKATHVPSGDDPAKVRAIVRGRGMRARPVDADGHEVKYRGSAAHDVQRDPHVTQSVSKLPLSVVHLNHTHTHTHTHTRVTWLTDWRIPLLQIRGQCKSSDQCRPSWTWVGLGWVGLGREITAFSCVELDLVEIRLMRFFGANCWHEQLHFYCHGL